MEMFKNFRLARGKAVLKKKLSRQKRKRFTNNISQAKSLGIVWDASNPDEFNILSQFQKKMAERNIDVKIIGYYPGKELPAKLTAIMYLTCLRKDAINLIYRPVSKEAEAFMNTRFDILIDINFKKVYPLLYITSLSMAGFKVGVYESENSESVFDLMMEYKSNIDVNSYLTEVINYLELINTNSKTQ
jgi:hypothetical protein